MPTQSSRAPRCTRRSRRPRPTAPRATCRLTPGCAPHPRARLQTPPWQACVHSRAASATGAAWLAACARPAGRVPTGCSCLHQAPSSHPLSPRSAAIRELGLRPGLPRLHRLPRPHSCLNDTRCMLNPPVPVPRCGMRALRWTLPDLALLASPPDKPRVQFARTCHGRTQHPARSPAPMPLPIFARAHRRHPSIPLLCGWSRMRHGGPRLLGDRWARWAAPRRTPRSCAYVASWACAPLPRSPRRAPGALHPTPCGALGNAAHVRAVYAAPAPGPPHPSSPHPSLPKPSCARMCRPPHHRSCPASGDPCLPPHTVMIRA